MPSIREPNRRWWGFLWAINRNGQLAMRYRSSLRTLLVCLAAGGAALTAVPAFAADPSGEWLVADHTARIRVERCADGYWGSIAWEQAPGIDKNNPDPSRGGRPLLGSPCRLP